MLSDTSKYDFKKTLNSEGWSLIELLVIVLTLTILSTAAWVYINPQANIERSRHAAAKSSLLDIAKAAQIYADQNGEYPAEVNLSIPQEFNQYLNSSSLSSGPFPGSVYDWDNWESQTCWDGSTEIIQVTLRQINDYKSKSNYTLYAVIQGSGVPHCTNSSIKGECVNCESRYP